MKLRSVKQVKVIKTISKSIREYKKQSLLAPLFVIFEVIFETSMPLIMSKMINEMTSDSLEPIYRYGKILIIMALLSLLSGFLSGKYAAIASTGFAKNLRQDQFDKIQDFSFKEIDKFSNSSLVTRLTTDVTNVQNAYQMIIRVAIRTPLMLIFSVIMSFSISKDVSVVFLVILPVLAFGLYFIISKVIPIFRRIFKKYDAMNNSVQENISGIRVVKSFVREDYEKSKFNDISNEVCKDFTNAEKRIALNNPLMNLALFSATILVSFMSANIIIKSGATVMNVGDLSSLVMYSIQMLVSLMMFSMVFVMISMSTESAKRITEVLNTESTLSANDAGLKDIKDGSISFENVSFRYSKEAKKYALEDVNLEIASGQTIGIIGSTGSAKSTLVQLIPRLYDTTVGTVKVGGVDVKKYNLKSLRDSVSMVLQKNVLFSGTIKENIRWGKEDASDEEIIKACKLAQADEFISQLPDGYDTYIERGGSNVSGGQKQRLCIARAIIKEPKVIIFDDSTSAVDTKTDALIRQAMSEDLPNTTKIITAQRVNSIMNADIILVMEKGRIVEKGTHEELMRLNGIYKEVYESQTKKSEGEIDE